MTQDQPLHERLVAALQARLEVARAQHEDPQHWPPEIWFDPEHGIVTVEVNGAKRYRSWLVTDHGELRTTWEWQPPKDAVQLLDPATEIRRVEALLRVVEALPHEHWIIRDLAAGEGIEP